MAEAVAIGGPFFDDLKVGDRFDGAPAVTLTDGLAAAHTAIVGGRLHLVSDHELSRSVTGREQPFASPALVWDIAIGQSTLVTQRAIANLFYRGLAFRTLPALGDTLRTRVEIVGLRSVSDKPGRPPRGLVVMSIATTDQRGATVLDFHRCAMLPRRTAGPQIEAGERDPQQRTPDAAALGRLVAGWNLGAYRDAVRGAARGEIDTGRIYRVEAGDVVSSAPELARLTLNLAAIHHDRTATADGERLVYGGHTIGLAAAQISRALPALVTILAWRSCDHTGPVHEGDTLISEIHVEGSEPIADGKLVHLRALVQSRPAGADAATNVLDWRLTGLMA